MTESDPRARDPLRVAVVLPARNEAGNIVACLESLRSFRAAGDEVLVVDAGSADATGRLAAGAGARVLCEPRRQRGYAVAAGYAAVAGRADVVLIGHADMRLPPAARGRIIEACRHHPAAVGGALGHRIDDPRLCFRLIERGNRWRARRRQLPYGDQAMFVRTKAVAQAGGFPEQPRFEDLELALRLRGRGRWLYLDCPVRIGTRHWRRGIIRTTLRNWAWALRYRLRRQQPALSIETS